MKCPECKNSESVTVRCWELSFSDASIEEFSDGTSGTCDFDDSHCEAFGVMKGNAAGWCAECRMHFDPGDQEGDFDFSVESWEDGILGMIGTEKLRETIAKREENGNG